MRTILSRWTRAAALALLPAVSACADLTTEPVPLIFWEATLASVGTPGSDGRAVSGRLAAITRERITEVSIALNSEGPESPLAWGVFRGSCDAVGTLVGVAANYPPLTAEAPSREILLSPRLTEDGEYHAAISTEADGTRVACGNLERTDA